MNGGTNGCFFSHNKEAKVSNLKYLTMALIAFGALANAHEDHEDLGREFVIIMVLFLMLKRIMKILGVVCHHHGALANAHEDHEDLGRE